MRKYRAKVVLDNPANLLNVGRIVLQYEKNRKTKFTPRITLISRKKISVIREISGQKATL